MNGVWSYDACHNQYNVTKSDKLLLTYITPVYVNKEGLV